MTLPRIAQVDGRPGFHWTSPDGTALRLGQLLTLPDAEPDRWLPTHLEALDDVLVDVAGHFGEVLGGGRGPRPAEKDDITAAYRAIDRLTVEYDDAALELAAVGPAVGPAVGGPAVTGHASGGDVRAGQIIGTGALMSIRLRQSIGLMAPAPFDGDLDVPGPGVVGGRAGLHWVAADTPWRGARWLVVTQDGRRLPATLGMLLFDSSGVDKESSLGEHRDALARVTSAVADPAADPLWASGAVDWLLFDWVMAHRDGPDSGAVEIRSGRGDDAVMIVRAAGASARVRARFDLGLLDLPRDVPRDRPRDLPHAGIR